MKSLVRRWPASLSGNETKRNKKETDEIVLLDRLRRNSDATVNYCKDPIGRQMTTMAGSSKVPPCCWNQYPADGNVPMWTLFLLVPWRWKKQT